MRCYKIVEKISCSIKGGALFCSPICAQVTIFKYELQFMGYWETDRWVDTGFFKFFGVLGIANTLANGRVLYRDFVSEWLYNTDLVSESTL